MKLETVYAIILQENYRAISLMKKMGFTVEYQNDIWFAVAPSQGEAPVPDSAVWTLLAGVGATGPQGPIGMMFRGAWNGAVAYVPTDAVVYQSGIWFAVAESQGQLPAPDSYAWVLLAGMGAQGPPGPPGPQGPVGELPAGTLILTATQSPITGYAYFSKAVMDRWSTRAALPAARAQLSAATVDDVIYVLGGFDGAYSSRNDAYNPAADGWTALAPLPTPRASLVAVVVNDTLYAIGGRDAAGALAANEAYSISANSWTARAPMPTARYDFAAAAVGEKIYVMGGIDGSGLPVATHEVYDTTTDTWATAAPLPAARSGLSAAAVNGKLYAVGGTTEGTTPSARNEEYDPVNDSWAPRASLQVPLMDPAVVAVEERLYAIGPSANLEYTPAIDSWTARSLHAGGRESCAAAAATGNIYLIGGDSAGVSSGTNEEYTSTLYYLHVKL
jgi:N-acetylneuraminic acid mutarotase